MNRQELWDRLKAARITQSTRPDCPPDADLKVVITCTQAGAKTLVDFLLSLDRKPEKPTL